MSQNTANEKARIKDTKSPEQKCTPLSTDVSNSTPNPNFSEENCRNKEESHENFIFQNESMIEESSNSMKLENQKINEEEQKANEEESAENSERPKDESTSETKPKEKKRNAGTKSEKPKKRQSAQHKPAVYPPPPKEIPYRLSCNRLPDPSPLTQFVTCHSCSPNLLFQPKRCSKCLKHFCQSCQSEGFDCPSSPGEKHSFVNPEVMAMELLRQLDFFCLYEPECHTILKYEEIELHEKSCEFKRLLCPFEGCELSVLAVDYKSHCETCPHEVLKCPHCSKSLKRGEMVEHEASCDLKPCKCQGCLKEWKQKEFQEHIAKCGDIKEKCRKCRKFMKRKELKKHKVEECLQNQMNLIRLEGKKLQKRLKIMKNLHSGACQCKMCSGYSFTVCMVQCNSCLGQFCFRCRASFLQKCTYCSGAFCNECTTTHKCEEQSGEEKSQKKKTGDKNQPVYLKKSDAKGKHKKHESLDLIGPASSKKINAS